ncbi:MAG: hypothetical protein ACYTFQ_30360 [Planctomycetota bacterium]|jgi:hypothetical protein
MTNENKPKSLQEMAAEAGGDLWTCSRCGCNDWRVVSSYVVASGNRHRRRVCRYCGQTLLRTEERPR